MSSGSAAFLDREARRARVLLDGELELPEPPAKSPPRPGNADGCPFENGFIWATKI